jgi:hypothetical protein
MFLVNVREQFGSSVIDANHSGILLGISRAPPLILLAMDEFYEMVDENLAEFLYLTFELLASQCGSHLAACYAKGRNRSGSWALQ